jgi:hypothetical protein
LSRFPIARLALFDLPTREFAPESRQNSTAPTIESAIIEPLVNSANLSYKESCKQLAANLAMGRRAAVLTIKEGTVNG